MQAERLRAAGLKVTKQRQRIVEALSGADGRMSAEDIHQALRAQDAAYSLSTVYRTLNVLEEAGIVERVEAPGGAGGLYRMAHKGHRHCLMCVACKKTVDMHCPVSAFSEQICTEHGFRMTDHYFEIFGVCPQCQQLEGEKR